MKKLPEFEERVCKTLEGQIKRIEEAEMRDLERILAKYAEKQCFCGDACDRYGDNRVNHRKNCCC